MNWYMKVLKQYADFSGRARRTEYWMFTLFNFIFAIIAMVLDNVLGLTFGSDPDGGLNAAGFTFGEFPYGWLYVIYGLFVFIPGLAVGVRRLHDLGKSGWMLLIAFIPLIGAIWLIVLFATEGEAGENEYGSNPKAVLA